MKINNNMNQQDKIYASNLDTLRYPDTISQGILNPLYKDLLPFMRQGQWISKKSKIKQYNNKLYLNICINKISCYITSDLAENTLTGINTNYWAIYKKDKNIMGNKEILKFIDIGNDLNFNRVIKEGDKYFKCTYINNILISIEKTYDPKIKDSKNYIKSLKNKIINKSHQLDRYLTLDIETYNKNNILIPYAIGFYIRENNKEVLKTFYLSDYKSPNEMIKECISQQDNPKYNNMVVYIHNLSKFDIVYLINALNKQGKIDKNKGLLIHDNNILSIIWVSNNKTKLIFKDSYLLLRGSLKSLSVDFNVHTQKGVFPHEFMDSLEKINYIGPSPSKELYPESYDYIFTNDWNAKEECIKYLKKDCISLWEIIKKFQKFIYYNEGINILKINTIAALAFSIFRTNYLKNIKIPIQRDNIDKDIRKAYYGGIVDIYKPSSNSLYYYDVNSLYPFAMLNPMPTGNPLFVQGNQDLDKEFGFYFATIVTPLDKKIQGIPILPKREIKNFRSRTQSPLGHWQGWYFSEELRTARDLYNYKIIIHKGYRFTPSYNIFSSYIEKYYSLKASSSSTLKNIAKLLLNSLYGRFGMHTENYVTKMVSEKEQSELIFTESVISEIPLQNGYHIVQLTNDTALTSRKNISIPIAAAITAYGRIYMHKFKHINNNPCFYTDTDSVFLEAILSDKYVGEKLGQQKLVYTKPIKATFISPKVYCLEIPNEFNNNYTTIIKAKGINLSNNLSNDKVTVNYDTISQLLNRNHSVSIPQIRLNKNLLEGHIKYSYTNSTLSVITSDKREYLYKDNIFYDTEPIHIIKSTNSNMYKNPLDIFFNYFFYPPISDKFSIIK